MTLHGFDISSHQAGINVAALPGDFIIVKATEGTDYTSATFAEQTAAVKTAGRLLGVYHFMTGENPETQARFFASTVKKHIRKAVLCLDLEKNGLTGNQSHVFVETLHNETGVWPLVYCSTSNLASMTDEWTRARCGIWQADWGAGNTWTAFPDDWSRPSGAPNGSTIAAWQFTSKFKTSSWARNLDADVFYGDAAAWRKYAKGDTATATATTTTATKTVKQIAAEVIAGKWGNGQTRRQRLEAAGYDCAAVQNEVNAQLKPASTRKTVDTLAREVIAGKWGNGQTRRQRLEAAGYDCAAVQSRVNQLLKG